MLALLLAVAMQSAPVTPVAPSLPALHMPAPDWGFIPSREAWNAPSTGVASLMFTVDIDPTAPVESEERADLDVYETEEPWACQAE